MTTSLLRGQPFHPTLAVAVLRILDVLTGMKKRSAIKAVVHIPCVRNVVPLDDAQQAVILLYTILTGIRTTALLLFLIGVTTQQGCDLLV